MRVSRNDSYCLISLLRFSHTNNNTNKTFYYTEVTVDPNWGADDMPDEDDSDDDDEDNATKSKGAKCLSAAKARIMSSSDVADLVKLGNPSLSSTQVSCAACDR